LAFGEAGDARGQHVPRSPAACGPTGPPRVVPRREDQVLTRADLLVLAERQRHALGQTVSALAEEGSSRGPFRQRRPRETIIDLHERLSHFRRGHAPTLPAEGQSVTPPLGPAADPGIG